MAGAFVGFGSALQTVSLCVQQVSDCLRMLTDDLDRGAHTTDVTLASGIVVRARLAQIAGAGGGTLFH
ncbi:hypothetical protein IU459_36975, partial [Nocardia amamiensis]